MEVKSSIRASLSGDGNAEAERISALIMAEQFIVRVHHPDNDAGTVELVKAQAENAEKASAKFADDLAVIS